MHVMLLFRRVTRYHSLLIQFGRYYQYLSYRPPLTGTRAVLHVRRVHMSLSLVFKEGFAAI